MILFKYFLLLIYLTILLILIVHLNDDSTTVKQWVTIFKFVYFKNYRHDLSEKCI